MTEWTDEMQLAVWHVSVPLKKYALPAHEECRRGAHLPSLGREPVGG